MKSFRWILVLVLRWPLHTPSSEVARSVQKCEVANCWGAGARILGSRRNLIAGGGISQPRYFTKRCWVSWFTSAGVTMRGLLAPARGQCQVSPWPLSGHSSSDSGSSKAIKEQMILLLLFHVTMHVNENKHGQLAIFWCRQEEAGKRSQKRKWTRRPREEKKVKHSGGIHDVTSSYKNMYDNVN